MALNTQRIIYSIIDQLEIGTQSGIFFLGPKTRVQNQSIFFLNCFSPFMRLGLIGFIGFRYIRFGFLSVSLSALEILLLYTTFDKFPRNFLPSGL